MNYTSDRNTLPEAIQSKLCDANIFFSDAYDRYTRNRGEETIYFWNNKEILPLRIKHAFFLTGGVFDTEPFCLEENVGEEEKQNFLDSVCFLLKKVKVHWVVCSQTSSFIVYPRYAKVVPKGNLIVDLQLSEEKLFQNIHSKHKNSIRRAEKNDVRILYNTKEVLNDYRKIEVETWKRSGGKGRTIAYFDGIFESLPNNADFSVAYKDGDPQAGGVFLYNTAMGYYLHGSTKSKPEPGAANYLLWNEMLRLKENGTRMFNFVGYRLNPDENSKLYGIQHFKERFGGIIYPSFNFRYVSNNFMYKLYCLAMQLKSHNKFKKYKDAIDEQIAKYPEFN